MLSQLVWAALVLAAGASQTDSLGEQFDAHRRAGRYAEAEKLALQTLQRVQESKQESSAIAWLDRLGSLYYQQRRYKEAEEQYRQSLVLEEKVRGPKHGNVAVGLRRLAEVQLALKRYDQAAVSYQRALGIDEKLYGPDDAKVALSLSGLAEAELRQRHHATAESAARRALAIREKSFQANHPLVAESLFRLAEVLYGSGKAAAAEPLYRRYLDAATRLSRPSQKDLATALWHLGAYCYDRERYDESRVLMERAVKAREKAAGTEDDADLATILVNLAAVLRDQGRYGDADAPLLRALAIRKRLFGAEDGRVAFTLGSLARLRNNQARFDEAESLCREALAIGEKALGADHLVLAEILMQLGIACRAQARVAEAEQCYARAIDVRRKRLGPGHLDVARSLHSLATIYFDQARYAEVEPIFKEVLQVFEKVKGPENVNVAECLDALAGLYNTLGRRAEAEPLLQRSLRIYEKILGPEHRKVAGTLNSLALLYRAQGRYAEAEQFLKRSLAIRRRTLGPEHPEVAASLNNLTLVYKDQARYTQAEPLAREAAELFEKSLGPEHPALATALGNLGAILWQQGRYADAEPLCRRALAIKEKTRGPDHPEVALTLLNLAALYSRQGRFAEAEPLLLRALAIREKASGSEHPATAACLFELAQLYFRRKQYDQSEPLLDRAILIRDRAHVAPDERFECYELRARIAWEQGRSSEAVTDLKLAMDLAEQQRGQSSGAEHERAEHFGKYAVAFERMLAWQTTLGNLDEAFDAIERGRSRSLLDEMNIGNADLQIGRTAVEREQLRRRESEVRGRIAALEQQRDALTRQTGPQDPAAASAMEKLDTALAEARALLYDHYRQARSTSPVYRNLLSVGAGRPRLSQIRRQLLQPDGLLLAYLLGEEGGYLLIVDGESARLETLQVDQAAASALGIEPGPLTAGRLQAALVKTQGDGVLQLLANVERTDLARPRLEVLGRILLPDAKRTALTDGTYKHLLVVPDGPLALLPLETLIVSPRPAPVYLLDVGPPIAYGPSATVLYSLAQRARPMAEPGVPPVLTLANPSYAAGSTESSADSGQAGDRSVRSRYCGVGGPLPPLPYSAWESDWLAQAFAKADVKADRLEGPTATEANLRARIAHRQIVHLACHGLADQAYGNFFGALALTPGPAPTEAADDGFLTLAEIYELDLRRCELAILSACQTNYGPEQRGEGVWALSRGFLVAGARRVVASNWLVDDEAAASLVSTFCTHLAEAEKEGRLPDHAAALQQAKRWIRQQEKWHSPYYWGPLVLVGPR